MRKSTLASMLILCGSTAAIANVAAVPSVPQATNNTMTMNNMVSDDMMSNDMTTDPMPGNEATPPRTPSRVPPGTMNNEMAPKPM